MQDLHDSQALLYQDRRKIKRSIRPLRLESHHFDFISSYLKKNRSSITLVIGLITLQALIEIVALLMINSSLRERIYSAIHKEVLLPLILVAIVGAFLYLLITYLSIKYERTAVLELINELRRRLFSSILQKPSKAVTNEAKADFVAKVSYHLPLLSLGIDHSVFGCIRWFLSMSILIALGIIAGTKLLFSVFFIIGFSVAIGAVAYLIARYYISQEVTSYSQVIRHITLSLTEFSFVKSLHQERSTMEELNEKVAIDTYFRIRRDLWLRYFTRVLLALLFIGSLVSFAVAFSHPAFTSLFYDPSSSILGGIISLYTIRLFYEAAQAGLYLPPVKLGLFLSVPKGQPDTFHRRKKKGWKSITFRSTKTKLFLEGEYFKNISISMKRGGRYLFTGKGKSGKTSLAHIFAGVPEFNQTGWLVKIDDQRSDMQHWMRDGVDRYLFKPQFKSEKTLGELILAKERSEMTEEDFARIYSLTERHPVFFAVLSKKRFMGDSVTAFQNSEMALFLIQALYCIVNKISLIVIDNHWMDLGYEEMTEILRILEEELPDSTLAVFSRKKNEIITYTATYEIEKGQIV